MSGAHGGFPTTRHSALARARSPDAEVRRQAYEALVSCYWKPVYKYLRARWNLPPEDAGDSTQEFFLKAIEKDFFQGYDSSRARFRTYIRLCLDTFVMKERRAAKRLKRGGGYELVPVDFSSAEGELRASGRQKVADVEEYFRREWIRGLVDMAIDALRRHYESSGRGVQFSVFERYDLEATEADDKPRYEDVGRQLGLSVAQVTNYLSTVRRAFRAAVLEKLREATGSEAEFHAEASEMFAALGPARSQTR
ncbi:MAG: hypothetical protein AB1714_10285 [Acidobacteriota bacterium]